MAADAVESLLAERCALSTSVAEVGQLLQQAKRWQKQSQRRADHMWHLTTWQSKVLLIVYVLAGYQVAPAAAFLAMQARKRKWPPRPEEEVHQVVGDVFLRADVNWVASLADEMDPLDVPCMKVAISFLHQFGVAEWVSNVNQQQGVAPPTGMVLQQLESRRLGYPEFVRPRHVGVVADARARVWARKWRMRWGARHARVRIRGEDMDAQEMRDKVCDFCQIGVPLVTPETSPRSSGRFQALFVF